MGKTKTAAPKKTRRPRAKAGDSRLTPLAQLALARTKAARAEIDASLEGFVDDDNTPVMTVTGPPRRQAVEQPEESEEMAVVSPERKKRPATFTKAGAKRPDRSKVRRAQLAAAAQDVPVVADAVMSAP